MKATIIGCTFFIGGVLLFCSDVIGNGTGIGIVTGIGFGALGIVILLCDAIRAIHKFRKRYLDISNDK